MNKKFRGSNSFRTAIGCLSISVIVSLAACGGGGGGDDGDGGSGGDRDTSTDFAFATDPVSAFSRIDRHGAVEAGTVFIAATSGLGIAPIRDEYNRSNPAEDAAGRWIGEITKSATDLHGALDDDLMRAGLVPASVERSLAQGGPVIVPDVIRYNPDQPTSYPNGRTLEDQVVDITIAVGLLDLSVPGQTARTLADLPLNPVANDVPFKSEFPYLADPHLP